MELKPRSLVPHVNARITELLRLDFSTNIHTPVTWWCVYLYTPDLAEPAVLFHFVKDKVYLTHHDW